MMQFLPNSPASPLWESYAGAATLQLQRVMVAPKYILAEGNLCSCARSGGAKLSPAVFRVLCQISDLISLFSFSFLLIFAPSCMDTKQCCTARSPFKPVF